MTNVIPFVARLGPSSVALPATARAAASIVADLVSVVAEIKEISERVLPLRYDAFLYLDRTQALHPLHIEPREGQPELYPWGV